MDASAGVEAGLEQAVALGRGDRHGRLLLHQQERPRERRPDGRARRAAGELRRQDRAAPAGDRGGRVVRGLRRPRPPQGLAAGTARPRSRSRSPTSLAAEVARRRDQLLEAAAEADDDVLTKYLEGEEIADAGARGLPAQGRQGVDPRAGPRRQRGQGHRPARPARRDRPLPPLPGRRGRRPRPPTRPAPTVEVAADEAGPLLVRVFKTTADPFVGRLTYLRVLSGTLRSQAHVWNSSRERGRADRPAAAAPRQGAGADRRAEGRRDRRGRQAGRDRDRRHAERRARSRWSCRRWRSRSRR